MDPKAATQRIQHMWDGIASAQISLVQDRVMADANDAIIAAVKAHLDAYEPKAAGTLDVLDLAGGSGYPAIPLANELPHARITLTDLSAKMVDGARERVAAAGLSDRIAVQQTDAQDLSAWQDGTFDVVTCQYGLFFMPEHVAALREAARVLRPGGLLAASVFGTGNQMPQLVEETVKTLQLSGPAPKNSVDMLADVAKTTVDFRSGGFPDVSVTPYSHTQVWDPEQCAELVCAFLKPALLKAHAEGRADMLEGAAPACTAAMKTLGFLSIDGNLCTLCNEAYLYTAVKPLQL